MRNTCLAALTLFLSAPSPLGLAQNTFDQKPILYSLTRPRDPIANLQTKLDQGKAKLVYEKKHGYLKSVLRLLNIPHSSQGLVFSKTSLQLRLIAPWSPRALYFNDDVYVGWIPHSDVIELSAVDPQNGAIFYTLAQTPTSDKPPRFRRDKGNCLSCHGAPRTRNVPGHLMRSVFTSATGLPYFRLGTYRTNQTSPLRKRFGGWYVTGTHGRQRHMGNVIATDDRRPEQLDVDAGANITKLGELLDVTPYLTAHSDIVALMVLAHQTDMHNLITYASYESRMALDYAAQMNKVLERPANYLSKSTKRRIATAIEKLFDHMLFVGEAKLIDQIRGTTSFAKQFQQRGKKDRQGRSLRQLDLKRRLFKYPCSYLVHSDAFAALPKPVKAVIYRRLFDVLTGKDKTAKYEHLSPSDRQTILAILRATHRGLPKYWK